MVAYRILSSICSNPLIQKVRNQPADVAATGLILIASPSVYLYAVLTLIPDVFSGSSYLTQAFAYVLATWCVLGILLNLYLVRHRHSSIRGRFLSQPVLATPPESSGVPNHAQIPHGIDGLHQRVNEMTKTLGQQFMANPFGSEDAWHICSKCEVYVPSRCWHCSKGCNTCILRRDHHCVFAMACIGEENYSNFLGFILYLFIGTAYALILLMIYCCNNTGMSYSWFLFKSVLPAVFLFYDFSLFFFLCSLCLLGSGVAAAFLVVYVLSAARGHSIGVRKHSITGNRFGKPSYRSLEQFLGLNPFWRIVWPFHPIYKPESTFVQMS